MKFNAKAVSIDNFTTWEGYYAEFKDDNNEIISVIIDDKGEFHKILPSTLRYYTGIMTEKAQPIYEGDVLEVLNDCDCNSGVVKWSKYDAGWVIEDEFGEYHDLVGDTRYFV